MEDQKKTAEPDGDSLKPEPPAIVRQVAWVFGSEGKKHRRVLLLTAGVLATGWLFTSASGLSLLKTFTDALVGWRIERAVKSLRVEYPKALRSLETGTGTFRAVEAQIDVIRNLDPANGHALYYAGEVRRVQNKSLFSSKSCLMPDQLAAGRQELHVFHNDFTRYLDIERALAAEDKGGDYSAELCYSRVKGYCPQRTAWVRHLLANDLLEEGILSSQRNVREEKLRAAIGHAEIARKLYRDDNGRLGFIQCKPTDVVIAEANRLLSSRRK